MQIVLLDGYETAHGRSVDLFDSAAHNGTFATIASNNPDLVVRFEPATGVLTITRPGDANCDGVFNTLDIDPMVIALLNPAAYEAMLPDCDMESCDVNSDGAVDRLATQPFFGLLLAP